jgi:hypothetical protein
MREVLDRLEEETAALSREMSEIETRLVDRAREAGVAAAQGATRAMLGELVERQDGLQAELAAAQTRLEENVRREGHAFGVWRGVAIAALILAAIALALSLYLLLV